MGHIYMLTSPSGKSYVGQTRNPLKNRLREHCSPSSKCTALAHAIKKYKGVYKNGTIENFTIESFECPDEDLNFYEELYITEIYETNTKGYNIRSGGEGGSHSDETKKKISEANLGKKLTAETKKRMSEAHRGKVSLGKKHTAETCAKIRQAKLGKKHTAETCAKIGKVHLGKVVSDEARKNMSEAQHKRAPPTTETRTKMSEAQRKRAPPTDEARNNIRNAALNRAPPSAETRAKRSESMKKTLQLKKAKKAASDPGPSAMS